MTAFRYALRGTDIKLILDRVQILWDEKRGARAVLAATEAGCPKVVSELLDRGAIMDAENEMGETPFQIAARLPKTRKDEFEEYLREVERKKEYKPKETIADICEETGKVSRELANIFLSQSLIKHDQTSISNQIVDIKNFVELKHFDGKDLGHKQKFSMNYDKDKQDETMLESSNLLLKNEWNNVSVSCT